nr:EOG090X0GO7 [Cyclestheria hislopi]
MDPGLKSASIYIDTNRKPIESTKNSSAPVKEANELKNIVKELICPDELLAKSVVKPGFEKLERIPSYEESNRQTKLKRLKEIEKTKGDKWFNLPMQEMNEEKQRDLEIIQMRSILNPKQFYKKNDLKVLPKYFQVGTVVENAADFYHSRLPKKERKRTLVEELMADANFQRYNKRKYAEIIEVKKRETGIARRARRLKKQKK